MNWLPIAIFAHFLLGGVVVVDKFILKSSYRNPVGYTFWLGILSLLSLVLLPFGFQPLDSAHILIALSAGAVFNVALLLLFSALFLGEASNVQVFIGGAASPLFTLIISSALIGNALTILDFPAFLLFVGGGLILFFTEGASVRRKTFVLAVCCAILLGLSNTMSKMVFLSTNFVTAFVWMKIGGAIAVASFLAFPSARRKILGAQALGEFKNKAVYVANRLFAGVGSLLFFLALSRGPAPLVDATTSLQFLFIFLGGWLILKENFRGWRLVGKIAALLLVSSAILWLGFLGYLKTTAPPLDRNIKWGVTFSQKFSQMMGLDWKQNYDAVLDDLGVKSLRLVAYWDLVEKQRGVFDFSDMDYQMEKAADRGASVILAVGRKEPRWPECHEPNWIKGRATSDKNKELLDYITAAVRRYKNSSALLYWQVENEPFLPFGDCPTADKNFLQEEISLVKSLDANHKVLLTDGGEFGLWYRAAELGDVFGTTMYRRVHNKIFGYIEYPLPPEYFRLKEKIARALLSSSAQLTASGKDKKFIVAELGAEPWLEHQLYETTVAEQLAKFNLPYFKDTIGYAKAAGFGEYYLWGAEWWYWMMEKNGDGSFWDFARSVINPVP